MAPDRRALLAGLAVLPFLGAGIARAEGEPEIWELPIPDMDRLLPTLWIAPLTPDIWVTCFTVRQDGIGYLPANGLIVAGTDGATIIDTGWTDEQGKALIAAARKYTGKPVARAIATHFHHDRTGGTKAMRAAGIPVLAHPFSLGLARAYGEPEPDPVPELERHPVQLGPIELFYPGPGHTRDNITVWHAPSRTLYGGCLLKSVTAKNIGSVEDADLHHFAVSVAAVAARYPTRAFTIPGHGTITGDSIAWTEKLARAAAPVP